MSESAELEYSKAKVYQRIFAFIIDLFLSFMLGLILSCLAGLVTLQVPSYQNLIEVHNFYVQESGLYNENDELYILVYEDADMTMDEKNEQLSSQIEGFYQNETFFSDSTALDSYHQRQLESVDENGNPLFVLSGDAIVTNGLSGEVYFDFYYQEVSTYCVSLLSSNATYADASNKIVRVQVIELALCMSVGFSFFFLLVPMMIKRGRRTLGMYLFKISLIGPDALNVKGTRLLGRNLLLLLIGYWLSIFTFGLPWIVSLTMMVFSKTGQSFFDYMSVTYVVDSKRQDVYLDYAEYLSRSGMKKVASVENNDFDLTD